jgi:hypothetical protein
VTDAPRLTHSYAAGASPRAYVQSDAEPAADTFIGHATRSSNDIVADAIARAHAARTALRELDGRLPEQPLAVTVRRTHAGAVAEPSALDVAAFAIGDRCVRARLAARVEDEVQLAADLREALQGRWSEVPEPTPVPFVTVALGDEPVGRARHGHRRAWRHGGDAPPDVIDRKAKTDDISGPWLGLGRAGELAITSTCHMIVDGYGHAWLAAKIAQHAGVLVARAPRARTVDSPALVPVVGGRNLDVAWRPLDVPAPRALPLAYALGRLLHRRAGKPRARSSPSFQIPVAPGATDDPDRRLRRVVPAIASVRFVGGEPEPFDAFAVRTQALLAREAAGAGVVSRLLAAARRAPTPLSWKRRAVGADRPWWLAPFADLLGGRGCASRIRVDDPTPPACAVSSPPSHDGFVATIVDDGARAALTLCGNGASDELLDQLVALLPD